MKTYSEIRNEEFEKAVKNIINDSATKKNRYIFYRIVMRCAKKKVLANNPREVGNVEDILSESLTRLFAWKKGMVLLRSTDTPGRLLLGLLMKKIIPQVLGGQIRKLERGKLFRTIAEIFKTGGFVCVEQKLGRLRGKYLYTHPLWANEIPVQISRERLLDVIGVAADSLHLNRGEYLPDRADIKDWLTRLLLKFGPVHLTVTDTIEIAENCMFLQDVNVDYLDDVYENELETAMTMFYSVRKWASWVESKIMASQVVGKLSELQKRILVLRGQGIGFAKIAKTIDKISLSSVHEQYEESLRRVAEEHPEGTPLQDIADVVKCLQTSLGESIPVCR